ncbi:death domain-containing protein CRADD [Melanotaenia boesemani]|uniref:death domain-containing protein CRADD n=1 Tax=Melanotaenia boesemani TaxID=1250792 RepID=UPI001C0461C6|nr:death domain-containing protein CRADD [Melanotaenia boesemani]XP_041833511.1 death domain-containing protein CRADD [Melanotaenia boesemani]XP_041833512.1 death domain-containing protein CRADD [Melanotaenia boesemani]
MEPAHRAVLRKLRVELSDQLLVSDTIVPFLYQEGILTEAHVEDIASERTNKQKNFKLLDILPNRGPRAFDAFLQSLEDFGWVRDRLLHELQAISEHRCGSKDVCQLPDLLLQKVPSDRELSRLASCLGSDWEAVLMDLGLSAEAVFRCRSDHSLSTQAAALAGLVQWRRSEGRRATVERLMQSLRAAGADPNVMEDALARPS